MNIILAKLLIALNLLGVALAALPSNDIALIPLKTPLDEKQAIIALIDKNFAPMGRNVAKTAILVAGKESQFNPKAKNPSSTASGLFQIISSTWSRTGCEGDKFRSEDNIACAVKIYSQDNNWSDWLASGDWK